MAKSNKVVIIEDELTTVHLLRKRLANAGFWTVAPKVEGSLNSFKSEVRKIVEEEDIHIAICDLTLQFENSEGISNGLQVLSELRQLRCKPFIIVLTGSIDESIFESLKAYKTRANISKESTDAYEQVMETVLKLKDLNRYDRDEDEDEPRIVNAPVNFGKEDSSEDTSEEDGSIS